MKTVAVTGATGFVGRALVPALETRGWCVRTVGRDTLGNLERPVAWSTVVEGVDAVVHLAGIAHSEGVADQVYEQVNHQRTAELAGACARAGVSRLVFVSSIKAQTGATSTRVLDETDRAEPVDAYGRSKLAAERAIAASGVAFTILRPVLIYGSGVKGNLASLDRIARLPLPLPFGAMTNRRSLCALTGLIEAIELVATSEHAVGQTLIAADREPIALPALISAIRRGLGRRPLLLPIPPSVLHVGLRLVRRSAMWERLGGELAVSSRRLQALGWQARVTANELAQTRLS